MRGGSRNINSSLFPSEYTIIDVAEIGHSSYHIHTITTQETSQQQLIQKLINTQSMLKLTLKNRNEMFEAITLSPISGLNILTPPNTRVRM